MTRSQMIVRSQAWIDARVPYSQGACYSNQYGSYRTDCSGYVSLIWGLGRSETTLTLRNFSSLINRADLRTGDALLNDGHVALFVRWADAAKTQPVVREQAGPNGAPTVERTWSASTAAGYEPRRYHKVLEETPTPTPPKLKDFNSDGRADIAAIDPDGTMVLFVGNGAGRVNYGKAMSGKGHWIGQRLLSTGDFNGDGKADIAAVSPSGTMELYSGNGAGDLGYSNVMSGAGHWAGQQAIAAGDFNGDGRADIAAISAEGTMELYTGNGAGGLGYSNAMSGVGHWNGFTKIVAGDFNSDGKTDIAGIDSEGTMALFTGNGAGGLGYGNAMSGKGHWAGQRFVTSGDFNNDGKMDIAGVDADGNLAYYTGNGAGGLGWGGPMWDGAHWLNHRALA
ncbi:FG-GAP repeat domain-containing protein [Lentzea atacamensis]|uniref:FG-GAP repeat domain-containing protein n=1 Tax=Lentzea atacamensis TaxID=531938 RepID=UPI001B862EC7|nr:VCBS repeat-containing protein [Lentzea atacamensis]